MSTRQTPHVCLRSLPSPVCERVQISPLLLRHLCLHLTPATIPLWCEKEDLRQRSYYNWAQRQRLISICCQGLPWENVYLIHTSSELVFSSLHHCHFFCLCLCLCFYPCLFVGLVISLHHSDLIWCLKGWKSIVFFVTQWLSDKVAYWAVLDTQKRKYHCGFNRGSVKQAQVLEPEFLVDC